MKDPEEGEEGEEEEEEEEDYEEPPEEEYDSEEADEPNEKDRGNSLFTDASNGCPQAHESAVVEEEEKSIR